MVETSEIDRGHECPGIEIDVYNEKYLLEKSEKVKCKLIKITMKREHPNLQVEIDGKLYFYGIVGVKADFTIVLRCQRKYLGNRCNNLSSILPSEYLKEIIINKSTDLKRYGYPKNFDKSDPRVYDIKNYDINSFDIGCGHKCPGTPIQVNKNKSYPGKLKKGNVNF